MISQQYETTKIKYLDNQILRHKETIKIPQDSPKTQRCQDATSAT